MGRHRVAEWVLIAVVQLVVLTFVVTVLHFLFEVGLTQEELDLEEAELLEAGLLEHCWGHPQLAEEWVAAKWIAGWAVAIRQETA